VAKFGAIPDLFEGGPSSTQNYRAKSRGNSINLKKVPNEFQKSRTWWLLHKRYLEHDQAGLALDGWAAKFFCI
jgi:hypothetical protein